MYAFTRRQIDNYKAVVVGVALMYVAITSTVSFLHSDDCPFSGRPDARETSFPSASPCPACKFLAGCNSVELPFDPAPVLIETYFTAECSRDSVTLIANPCTGSITLRAPPTACLS